MTALRWQVLAGAGAGAGAGGGTGQYISLIMKGVAVAGTSWNAFGISMS